MPNISPVGGLSLIVHIMVNVIVFSYRKIAYAFNLAEKNIISRTAEKLYSKEGDTPARQVLAYTLVLLVMVTIGGNAFFVTTRTFSSSPIFQTEPVSASPYPMSVQEEVLPLPSETTSETENANTVSGLLIAENSVPQTPVNIFYVKENSRLFNLTQGNYTSIVDFLALSGIASSSFDNRAELAKELGVVTDKGDYGGTVEQNIGIIRQLQYTLKNYLAKR